MTSTLILERPSAEATAADLPVVEDLLDTFAAHRSHCVGMAANMIGVCKRIIVFDDKGASRVMLNPQIVSKQGPYEAEEGCLSLPDRHRTTRYKRIKVSFLDRDLRARAESFSDYTAQIIQHEIDHCNGIVI